MTYREWTDTSETHADYRAATANCAEAFAGPRPDVNTWVHPGTGEKRRYINGLAELVGLEVTRYKTGNVSSASLNNRYISNGKATRLLLWLDRTKVWLDEAGALHVRAYGDSEHITANDLKITVRRALHAHGIN